VLRGRSPGAAAAGPLREPRFLADAHLGRLARDLRLLGFDTAFANDLGDDELARRAAAERRILLTRDRQLLMRREVTHGCYLRPARPEEQLAYVVRRLQLCRRIRPFTRCTACNTPVEAVGREIVAAQLPPSVRRVHDCFWRCGVAGGVLAGSHWRAMAGAWPGCAGGSTARRRDEVTSVGADGVDADVEIRLTRSRSGGATTVTRWYSGV